jgi:hypothetical protein
MNMPGFDAESSLGPTIGIYRGTTAIGRLQMDEVTPSQNLDSSFFRFGRSITCCLVGRHPPCVTFVVPVFLNCECQFGAPVCAPLVVNRSF